MSTIFTLLRKGWFCGLCITALVSCAPVSPIQAPASGYPVPQDAILSNVSGYPAPDVSHPSSAIVTPPANERIGVGPITAAVGKQSQLSYSYREEVDAGDGHPYSRVFVGLRSRETRLGDDTGLSAVDATSERYISWRFRKDDSTDGTGLQSGLYVYEIEAGKNVLVALGATVGLSKIGDDWIIYVSEEGRPQPATSQLLGNDIPHNEFTELLLAYNLATNTALTVTESLPIIAGRGFRSFYDVNGSQVSWIEYDLRTKTYTIKLMDLSKGITRALPIEPKHPLFLSMSTDLLVWRDTYWHGYSFLQNEFFTIPYAPAELEDKSGVMVTAKDTAVEWSYTANGKDYQRFSAPIITKQTFLPSAAGVEPTGTPIPFPSPTMAPPMATVSP